MFPLRSDCIIFDQEPTILISDEQDQILEELLAADYAASEGNEVITAKKKKRIREKKEDDDHGSNVDHQLKKSMHRDIERQRRQEMSVLYASLRSLLPLEYVKGKRAISDHMHQAVNYIKHTQKKIEEMRMRRDKLTNLSNANAARDDRAIIEDATTSSGMHDDSSHIVKVNVCSSGGTEILISTSTISIDKGSTFALSKVFVELLERGFDVIACVSTRVDKGFLHKIQIEQNDDIMTSIDVTKLQEGLVNVMKRA